jgi:radical SAM-linked protein
MAVEAPAPRGQVRFRYAKTGKIRFTSQRDVARMWERALRRSRLPVAWSQGFSPRPLLSFGLALPTGCESLAEYVDVTLDGPPPPAAEAAALAPALSALLPDGVDVGAAALLPHGAGSLQQEVTSCSWVLEVRGVCEQELTERIGRLLLAPSVPIRRERKGRAVDDDLRPSVLSLDRLGPGASHEGPSHRIGADLATRPRGVRPGELLKGLGADLVLVRACRTHQWIERDAIRREPLPVDGSELPPASAPHARERAS